MRVSIDEDEFFFLFREIRFAKLPGKQTISRPFQDSKFISNRMQSMFVDGPRESIAATGMLMHTNILKNKTKGGDRGPKIVPKKNSTKNKRCGSRLENLSTQFKTQWPLISQNENERKCSKEKSFCRNQNSIQTEITNYETKPKSKYRNRNG